MSDNEIEIANEMEDLDGKVKIAKDMRGYDDQDAGVAEEDASSNSQLSTKQKPKGGKDKQEDELDNYTKPLREAHAKYLQYLKGIDIDKEKNVFTVNIAFPLEFKKVLMLTLAE